jgi:hypothetical protein
MATKKGGKKVAYKHSLICLYRLPDGSQCQQSSSKWSNFCLDHGGYRRLLGTKKAAKKGGAKKAAKKH